jgi:hypothetical protein
MAPKNNMFIPIMKSRSKIFSFFFLFVFLVSNTGLPLTLHLCRMMDIVSVDSCEMCTTEKVKKTCCSEDSADEIITSGNSSCCETKFAAEPLKDRFISAKEELSNLLTSIPFMELTIQDKSESFTYSDVTDSPPCFQDRTLFILNSSFLI